MIPTRERVVPLLLLLLAGLGIYSVSQVHLPVWAKLVIAVAIAGTVLAPAFKVGKAGQAVALWVTTLLVLGFCLLAAFSVGFLFIPAALASLALATVFSFSRPPVPG